MINPSRLVSTICLCLLAIFTLPSVGKTQSVVRIAAVVNDDIISVQDLTQRIRLAMIMARQPNTPEIMRKMAPTILQAMINERLKTQAAEKNGIEVTEEEVDAAIKRFQGQLNIPDGRMNDFLNANGIDVEVIREQARAELGWSGAVIRENGARIRVSERDVDEALAEQEANKGKYEYRYSEITLPIEGGAKLSEVQNLAERLYENLEKGAPFAALARDFSQSPLAARGGDAGWVLSGQIEKSIEELLLKLPIGSFSKPIQTSSGIQIIQVTDRRISGDDRQNDKIDLAQYSFLLKNIPSEEALQDIQNFAQHLVGTTHTCDDFLSYKDKYPQAGGSRINDIVVRNMPGSLRGLITNANVNQALVYKDQTRVAVLMVCKREKAAEQVEIAVRKQIEQQLRAERIARIERRMLQDLRRNAFVDIRL